MATGWVEVFETGDPEEAELARELLRNKGILSRLGALPGVKTVEGLGTAGRLCLEVHEEDCRSANTILEEGMM